jgi:hypothetical protein
MTQLYASNLTGPLEISQQDAAKIGRGEHVGYSYGTVTDLKSGKVYEVFQDNCGGDNCNCAVSVQERA